MFHHFAGRGVTRNVCTGPLQTSNNLAGADANYCPGRCPKYRLWIVGIRPDRIDRHFRDLFPNLVCFVHEDLKGAFAFSEITVEIVTVFLYLKVRFASCNPREGLALLILVSQTVSCRRKLCCRDVFRAVLNVKPEPAHQPSFIGGTVPEEIDVNSPNASP